jgi:hypothetical protein
MAHAHAADELVTRGREAAARGAWREAYDFLAAADSAELSPEDLELIGEATSWTGPTEHCIEVRERAFSAYLASGIGEARLALALVRGHSFARASSVASGWYKRAERLLEEEPECREHGLIDDAAATAPAGDPQPTATGTVSSPEQRSGCDVERGFEPGEVGGAEHDAIACRDVDEIQVDAGARDLACQIGEHAGSVLDIDDDDFALARYGEMRDRQRVLGGLGVGDEDVELGPLARSDAGRGGNVHAGVAYCSGDAGQRPGFVLDVDDQVEWHVTNRCRG